MAKKSKLDLSGEGLKKIAINHGEKMVFALCAVVLVLLAYFGFSRPTFDDSTVTPKNLIKAADNFESEYRGNRMGRSD